VQKQLIGKKTDREPKDLVLGTIQIPMRRVIL